MAPLSSGSKVKAILLNGLTLPIDEVASGIVCICSLRSRLVFMYIHKDANMFSSYSRQEFLKVAIIQLNNCAKNLKIWTFKCKTGKTVNNFSYLSQFDKVF